ncbi:MAG: DUF1684 domain-containing protein [Propionicimonas sp.]|uniref:DUF1684 domain-containing protein n=1 Tax=Propionicimonas sp. TaxID=1955623 RepID=UPI003D0E6AC7
MSTAPQAWREWRERRRAEFAEPHGWLSVTTLDWLAERPAAVPGLPGLWWADAGGFHVDTANAPGTVLVDGTPLSGTLLWDGTGAAPRVEQDGRVFELLVRGLGRRAVRVRDPEAPALRGFRGIPVHDYDPRWRITATYRPYPEVRAVTVASALPGVEHQQRVSGAVEFEADGARHVLAVNDGTWIAFEDAGDPSNHHGRWLDVDTTGDGPVVLDFNFAENPPCAFTSFATCPLPPAGNILAVAVRAGERDPGNAS